MFGVSHAQASFHFWDINEVYSNADGSVQYIELFTASNNQQFTSGRVINVEDGGVIINTFTFPGPTPSPTAEHHLLIATPGFAVLPGAVTPDFTLPSTSFFNQAAAITTIDFMLADLLTFTNVNLPTDGVLSLNANLTTGTNSPTNFNGDAGSLTSTPPLTGDLDSDGFVGITDLNIVLGD
jgi:serralysin